MPIQRKGNAATSQTPIQALRFSRYLSTIYYNEAESKLVAKEKRVTELLASMIKYTPRFPDITNIQQKINQLNTSTLQQDQYQNANTELDRLYYSLDGFSAKITKAGFGDAYGTNAANTKVGRIIDIILNTIGALPSVFNTTDNHDVIKEAIFPDINDSNIVLNEAYLGESDVEFAKMRHRQIIMNLFKLEQRVLDDWTDLQGKFGLQGSLAKIQLTGSDLHKKGQQVAIVHASGGQKVVYKPRSVRPDVALLDTENGVFAALNKMSDNRISLPGMKFHNSSDRGAYAEFVEQKKMRTIDEIKQYYRQMGQLVVASKLFGVNDLHYENIMAAANGPTVIDAETSLLMNVMTARDFQSNELQMGLFTHVSVIDDKLSNNSFYTEEEKNDWSGNDWDKYIGEIRDGDVKNGGFYEINLKQGIADILQVIKTKRKSLKNIITKCVEESDDIRVVPIKTSMFKLWLKYYREWNRLDNEEQVKNTIINAGDQVHNKLIEKGYKPHNHQVIYTRLREDFSAGDIPVLHYSGKTKKLTWNGNSIGGRIESTNIKKAIQDNITWIAKQTTKDILDSLQG